MNFYVYIMDEKDKDLNKMYNLINKNFDEPEKIEEKFFKNCLDKPINKFFQVDYDQNKNKLVTEFIKENNCEKIVNKKINNYDIDEKLVKNILNNNITINQYFIELKNNYSMDKRNEIKYISELVRGWVLEDLIIHYSKNLKLNGKDKKRKILNKTSSKPDFINTKNNTKIDLYTDYTGYWKNKERLEIKKTKYNELKNNGLLLCLDLKNKKLFKLKITEDFEDIGKYSLLGGKKCYRYKFNNYKKIEKVKIKNLNKIL